MITSEYFKSTTYAYFFIRHCIKCQISESYHWLTAKRYDKNPFSCQIEVCGSGKDGEFLILIPPAWRIKNI